jgi:23S rRNA (uracil1939-C5)-methyltransferase
MQDGDEFEVTVGALTYGRAAVARADGKVVFVEDAAPGDVARVRTVRDRGSYVEAEIVELLQAGAARVEPPCPIVATCGGCCWQHVDYAEQLGAKRAAIIDALERIANVPAPPVAAIVPSPNLWGYRNRLRLRFDRGRLGFYRARSHALVPIEDCRIADDRVRRELAGVERLVASLDTRVTRVEIASRELLPGVVVAINSQGRLRPADGHRVRAFLAAPDHDVRGVVMWGRGWSRQWGDPQRRLSGARGITVETRGASFGQVNSAANALLVDEVLRTAEPRSDDSVLDLYAGAGNYSLPLAARAAHVLAIEADREAVDAGKENAARLGLGNLEFRAERVESYLSRSEITADIVVANPPRDGLGASAALLARKRIPRLIYVSCNPTTLARDWKEFASQGYALCNVVPFDLFPHTFHVEIVCDARLT